MPAAGQRQGTQRHQRPGGDRVTGGPQRRVRVEDVLGLPGVHEQPRRQAGTGAQPVPVRHLVLAQPHDRPVFRRVGADLGGGQAQPGAAQRVQRVPVDDALFQVGQPVPGVPGEGARPTVRRRLRSPGEGEVRHAVGDLGREPGGVRPQRQYRDQRGRIGVPPAVEVQLRDRRRERRRGTGRPAQRPPVGQRDGEGAVVPAAPGDAGQGLARDCAPQPGEHGAPGVGFVVWHAPVPRSAK